MATRTKVPTMVMATACQGTSGCWGRTRSARLAASFEGSQDESAWMPLRNTRTRMLARLAPAKAGTPRATLAQAATTPFDREGRSAGAVGADQVHLRGARDEDGRAVRRPSEELPELRSDPSLARAVRVDDPHVFPRPDVPGASAIGRIGDGAVVPGGREHDPRAVGRPRRPPVLARRGRQAADVAPVCVHHEDVVVRVAPGGAGFGGHEGDPGAVGRPRRVLDVVAGDATKTRAVRGYHVAGDIDPAGAERVEGDPPAIRRP